MLAATAFDSGDPVGIDQRGVDEISSELGERIEQGEGLALVERGSEPVAALVALGYRGLVIEAAGGGSVPPTWATPLGMLAREIPVLYATRTGVGPALRSTYGGTGAEIDLQNRGLIPAGTLDGLKARVLLTVLLAAGADEEEIRHALEGYTTSTCNASARALDAI